MPSTKNNPHRFQSQYTRSTFHWTAGKTKDGRIAMHANKKGVPALIGTVANLLDKYGAMSKGELLESLHDVTGNTSLRVSDLSQPFKRMDRLGMLRRTGHGSATVYALTPNGKALWTKIKRSVRWS